MAAALDVTLLCDRRTSRGEPVEPEVVSRIARSGCSSCALRLAPDVDLQAVAVGVEDDVGVVGRQPRVGPVRAARRREDHRMAGGERREVGHHGVDRRAATDEHEPAGPAERRGQRVDAVGQLLVRDHVARR